MFDIGVLELVLLGIVALLVLGPERLPQAARMTGTLLGRVGRMVQSFKDDVEAEVGIYEMQQRIKKQVEQGMIGDLRQELSGVHKAIQEGFNETNQSVTSSVAGSAATKISLDLKAPVNTEAVAAAYLPSALPAESPRIVGVQKDSV